MSLLEPFLEAVPTTLMSMMLVINADTFEDANLRGEFEGLVFVSTFISSWISASLGLAICLKVGAAGVIGQEGPGDGLLSGRFILAFFGNPI